MNEKLKNIIKFVIMMILFFSVSTIISYIFKLLGINTSLFDSKDYCYYDTLLEIILCGFIFIFYKKSLKNDKDNFNSDKKANFNKLLKLFCIFLVIKIASGVVTAVISTIFGYTETSSENQNIINSITGSAPIMMLITASILTPVVEESIFRLGFRKVFKNKYTFIIISGLIFGLMHIFPTTLDLTKALIDSISYIAMGVTLAYMYAETDNIWYTILIHGINNFISMLAVIALT